jgi:hypothetical protein
MSNAHTPGPWEAWQTHSAVFVVACDFHVALLCDGNSSQISANAHLLAAAPSMLAALILAEIAADPTATADERAKAKSAIRAAIAKAGGLT